MLALLYSEISTCAAVNQQSKKPISQRGLTEALSIGGLTTSELVQQVEQRGVDFRITSQSETELVAAGAQPELIRAVRLNYRPDQLTSDRPSIRRWTVGLTVQDVTLVLAFSVGLSSTAGVFVSAVKSEGPAAKAGVRPRDVIIGFNDMPVADTADLLQRLRRIEPGQDALLTIQRDGRELSLRVVTQPI